MDNFISVIFIFSLLLFGLFFGRQNDFIFRLKELLTVLICYFIAGISVLSSDVAFLFFLIKYPY